MPKSKSNEDQAPSVKPWTHRVGQKANSKRDREPRVEAPIKRRNSNSDPSVEELLLRAEIKKGGINAKIAYAKLRALKQGHRKIDENWRLELVKRLEGLHEETRRKEAEERAKIPEI